MGPRRPGQAWFWVSGWTLLLGDRRVGNGVSLGCGPWSDSSLLSTFRYMLQMEEDADELVLSGLESLL